MPVQSGAHLRLAEHSTTHRWDDPFAYGKSLLRGLDERSVVTERRRVLVGDIGGGRRPQGFITSQQRTVYNMPVSRHGATLKLRRLERKVLLWKSFWGTVFSVFGLLKPHLYR